MFDTAEEALDHEFTDADESLCGDSYGMVKIEDEDEGEPDFLVCVECGEAFSSMEYAVAHSPGCEPDDRITYRILPEREAM